MRTIETTLGPCIALLLLGSCAQSRTEKGSGTDSTTHWLQRCSSDAECGALECLCGECNTSCTRNAHCKALDADAVCSAVAASCRDAEQSCAVGPQRADAGGDGGGEPVASGAGASAGVGGQAGTDAGAGAGGSDPTEASCGLPWYQCPEGCSALSTLRGATRWRAQCETDQDCDFNLMLGTSIVLDEGTCHNVGAELTVQSESGIVRVHTASLTPDAWEQAVLLAIELEQVRFMVEGGGCASCEGVDGATLVLSGVDQLTHTFGYIHGEPPALLIDADAFVQALIDQLLACRGPLITGCSSRNLADEPGTALCQFTWREVGSDAIVSCGIDPAAPTPCRAAVECLCTGSAPPFGPNTDVQACADGWFQARGATTFVDVCSRDPENTSYNLSEALVEFARTQNGIVSSNALCESIRAWY